jgi:hypothetical protein
MNINSRLAKLEARHAPARRLVVAYADQTDPAELEALRRDPGVTLLVVEYVDSKPRSTYTDGNYSFTVGIDVGKI